MIPAIIKVDGQPDQLLMLPLNSLYTTKSTILRDSRYIVNTEYPTVVLGKVVPAIEVYQIFSQSILQLLTPLM